MVWVLRAVREHTQLTEGEKSSSGEMNISLWRDDCSVAFIGYYFALRCQWQTVLTPGAADALPEETVARMLFRIFVALTCWSPPLVCDVVGGGGGGDFRSSTHSYLKPAVGVPHCYTTLLLGVGKACVLYWTTVYLLHRLSVSAAKVVHKAVFSGGPAECLDLHYTMLALRIWV